MSSKSRFNIIRRRGFLWVTLALFVLSVTFHWIFGWKVFTNTQREHNQPVVFKEYVEEMLKDTMENWQSEFLQLIWQVAGLAILWYAGSPQSKEGDDRKEEKLDFIIKKLDPENYAKLMKEWESKFPKN